MDLLTKLVEEAPRFGNALIAEKGAETIQRARHELLQDFKAAIPIRIQNVANYIYLESDREQANLYHDFPNLAPPWPQFFMSYKRPPRMRTKQGWERPKGPTSIELGYLCTGDRDEAIGGWTLTIMAFGPNVMCSYRWRIDTQGQLLREGNLVTPPLKWPEGYILDPSRQGDLESIAVPLLAICFCHCKNIPLVREPVPTKVKTKRDSAHGWSPDAWHTLQIEPMRKQLNAAGASEPGGLKRALHIMRGHFKDYRDGRGLFGKTHGTWWWNFRLTDSHHLHRYEIERSAQ
jgi:hypothetical protein